MPAKRKKFNLVDYTNNYDEIYTNKVREAVSRMVIKYGGIGDNYKNCTDERIREFWNHEDPYPNQSFLRNNIGVDNVKWFIHHKLEWKDDIWNADFLHGMVRYGKVKWNKNSFPSLRYKNPNVTELIKICPFGGSLSIKERSCNWRTVPALYLKHTYDTASYLAGVMSCADIIDKDGYKYAKLTNSVKPCIVRAGIPIEFSANKYFLISPIWTAIFSIKMPEQIRDKWLNIKKAYGVEFYAPILWKTYVSNTFIKNGIPYLKSQRTVYYDFEKMDVAGSRDGKILDKIDRERVNKGLTMLSSAARDVVKMWVVENELTIV